MRTFIFSVVILFQAVHAMGQADSLRVKVQWGDERRLSRSGEITDIIGQYADKYFVLGYNRGFYNLQRYDKALNHEKTFQLKLRADKRNYMLEHVLHVKDKFYIFSSWYNRKLKKRILFAQEFNPETFKLNPDKQEVARIPYSRTRESGSFGIDLSPDSATFLVYYQLPYQRREKERFGFHVFDLNLNQKWQREIKLPYTDELFNVEDYQVDNAGNAYVLGTRYMEKKRVKKRDGKPNYEYVLISYMGNGQSVKEYAVQLKDRFVTDMQIGFKRSGDIVAAGFYSDKGTFSIKGSFFLTIDKNSRKIVDKSLKDFDLHFITQNFKDRAAFRMEKRAAKGKKVELFEYDLDEIVIDDKDRAMLIAEQYYVRVSTSYQSDPQGGTYQVTTYHYYYNDIIVLNMDPDGTINWSKKIAKRQHSVNDDGIYSSYTLARSAQRLYFLFNDNQDNLDFASGKSAKNFSRSKQGVASMVRVDENGNLKKTKVFNNGEAETVLRPKWCKQLDSGEILLYGVRRNKFKLGVLRVNL